MRLIFLFLVFVFALPSQAATYDQWYTLSSSSSSCSRTQLEPSMSALRSKFLSDWSSAPCDQSGGALSVCGTGLTVGWTRSDSGIACPRFTLTASAVCPGGGVPTSGKCSCAGNFDPVSKTCSPSCPAGQSPDAYGVCIAAVSCSAGTIRTGVMLSSPGSGSVCSADGCAYSGSVSTSAPIVGHYGTMSNLQPYYQVTWSNTGKTCGQAGIPAGMGAALVDNPGSDAVTCATGQVLQVSGTTGTCVTPADPSKSTATPTPSNLAPVSSGTGSGGSGTPTQIDKSGLATDANQLSELSKLDQLHTDLATDGVKIKEGDMPTDSSLSAADTGLNDAAQAKLDQISSIAGSGQQTTLDWVWAPSIPDGACDAFDFSGHWASGVSVDICSGGKLDTLRALLAWAYSLFAVAYIWNRSSSGVA